MDTFVAVHDPLTATKQALRTALATLTSAAFLGSPQSRSLPSRSLPSRSIQSGSASPAHVFAHKVLWQIAIAVRVLLVRPVVWILTQPFRYTRVRVALVVIALLRLGEWLRDLLRSRRAISGAEGAEGGVAADAVARSLAAFRERSMERSRSRERSRSKERDKPQLRDSINTAIAQAAVTEASTRSIHSLLQAVDAASKHQSQNHKESVDMNDVPVILPSRTKTISRSARLAPSLRKTVSDMIPMMQATKAFSVDQAPPQTLKPVETSEPLVNERKEEEAVSQQNLNPSAPAPPSQPPQSTSLLSGSPMTTEKLESEMGTLRASLQAEISRVKQLNKEKDVPSKRSATRKASARSLREQYNEVMMMQEQSGISVPLSRSSSASGQPSHLKQALERENGSMA
eukprot:TRINITY_DN7961_c0_g1_i1.p1 TRINITY_DN7961_c0_g1~~TRINITY_DN7961_c0_g1_i1.p1  ORF type:complete len:401 (+),score=69.51 TRINITY_DN7961_c0_g1_i1:50-1252(+)